MDVRERVEQLARALTVGIDPDDWFAPGARLSLPSVGLDRDLRQVLRGMDLLPLAECRVEVAKAVRNVVVANWDVALRSGGGGEGSAVLSFDREGLVTHLRVDGALLAAGGV